LLDAAVSGFTLTAAEDQIFTALTRAGRGTGRATGKSEAATITVAAIGVDDPGDALVGDRQ
jgi:hypothetical protein